MTPEDRKTLAEQLLANPLWAVLMAECEANAIERLIAANTDIERMERQAGVRAARTFRQDCEALARNTRPKKDAPC